MAEVEGLEDELVQVVVVVVVENCPNVGKSMKIVQTNQAIVIVIENWGIQGNIDANHVQRIFKKKNMISSYEICILSFLSY